MQESGMAFTKAEPKHVMTLEEMLENSSRRIYIPDRTLRKSASQV